MGTAQSDTQGTAGIILEDIGLHNGEDYFEGTFESGSEESTGFEEVKKKLANSINDLPESEKTVLSLYYYDGLTFKEIGDVMGLTELKAGQLHSQAILELKSKFKNNQKGISEKWKNSNAATGIVI